MPVPCDRVCVAPDFRSPAPSLIAFASFDASAVDRVRVFGAASCADLSCAKLSCADTITFQSEGRRRIQHSTFRSNPSDRRTGRSVYRAGSTLARSVGRPCLRCASPVSSGVIVPTTIRLNHARARLATGVVRNTSPIFESHEALRACIAKHLKRREKKLRALAHHFRFNDLRGVPSRAKETPPARETRAA